MPTPSILVGLIGAGIQASRAPRLHEQEGCDQGLRYLYKLVDLDVVGLSAKTLPELLTSAERLGFTGLNITFPCKQRARSAPSTPCCSRVGVVSVTIPTGRDSPRAFGAR